MKKVKNVLINVHLECLVFILICHQNTALLIVQMDGLLITQPGPASKSAPQLHHIMLTSIAKLVLLHVVNN